MAVTLPVAHQFVSGIVEYERSQLVTLLPGWRVEIVRFIVNEAGQSVSRIG